MKGDTNADADAKDPMLATPSYTHVHFCIHIGGECSGSVVECLTRDRGASGSGLTGVTALWSLSNTHLS